LAELHFNNYETDLVERELGYVMAFDHDLDMFAASIGLTKTSVAAIIKEEGDSFFSFLPSLNGLTDFL
jgi:dynactin 1